MKRILLIASILFAFTITNAQTVNDVPIKDIDVEYIQIVGTQAGFSKKVNIEVDFGQETKFFSTKGETFIKDENGKIMKFNSMIDALNFFSKYGYNFIQAYAFVTGNQTVYHYLLKKEKTDGNIN